MSEFDDDEKTVNPEDEQNTEPTAPEAPDTQDANTASEGEPAANEDTEPEQPEQPEQPAEQAQNSGDANSVDTAGTQGSAAGVSNASADADEANTTYHFSYRNAGTQNNPNNTYNPNGGAQNTYGAGQQNAGTYGYNYGTGQNNAGSYAYGTGQNSAGQNNAGYGSYNYGQNNNAAQNNGYGSYNYGSGNGGAYGYGSYSSGTNSANGSTQNFAGTDGSANGSAPAGNSDNTKPAKPKKEKKKSKTSTTVKVIAIILAACIVIAGIAIGVSLGSTGSSDSSSSSSDEEYSDQIETKDQDEVATKDADGDYTVAGVAAKCMDSCVGISVYAEVSSYYNYFFNYGNDSAGEEQLYSEGSGVLMLESSGKTYVMTCAHVISEGSRFVVTLNDGTECDATVIGYDSQTDIGVLTIDKTGLSIAEFADSDSCVVGEEVVAIGCPGGVDFMNSVTHGCISALDRPIASSIGYDYECIQTDAAINPGNSGGALFNMQGQVVGINSARIASTDYENIGFAVPSNTAVNTANSLINVGYVTGRAKIGITYTNIENYSNADSILSALEKQGYKDAEGAMVINEVNSDSDLANKDVRQYDIIIAVDGKTLTDTDIMTSALAEKSPGDTITLTFARVENNSIDIFDIECKLIESTE